MSPRWSDITQKPDGFVDEDSHMIVDQAAGNPTTAKLETSDQQCAIYTTSSKFVIAYNNGGTITYITLPFDGSTRTWTHSTTAP